MKLVIDSNVLIAAFAVRGLCQALFEYCLENHEVVLCGEIIKEVKKNLRKKVKLPASLVADIVAYIRESTYIEKPLRVNGNVFGDKSDLTILGVAAASNSACLITGDKALLSLKKYGNTDIISPRSFWEAVIKRKENI